MTRVLLAPENPAGVATALRDALRARGHAADVVSFRPHRFGLAHDRLAATPRDRVREGFRAARAYDVLHWQFGTTLVEFADAAWARVVGRPLQLMHYWGDDARTVARSEELGSIRAGLLRVQADEHDDRTVVRRLRLASRLCHAAVVSDLELAAHVTPYMARVYLVPTPLGAVEPGDAPPPPPGDAPIVFHAPSDPRIKGTAEITPVLERLQAAGEIRARIVTGVPRTQVLAEMARADIVLDQIAETSGVLALEAMALGRPVMAQYRLELLAPFARSSPIVATTAATLQADIAALCADPARRTALGAAGRRFIAEVHDAARVARALEHVYAHARSAPPGRYQATAEGITPLTS